MHVHVLPWTIHILSSDCQLIFTGQCSQFRFTSSTTLFLLHTRNRAGPGLHATCTCWCTHMHMYRCVILQTGNHLLYLSQNREMLLLSCSAVIWLPYTASIHSRGERNSPYWFPVDTCIYAEFCSILSNSDLNCSPVSNTAVVRKECSLVPNALNMHFGLK